MKEKRFNERLARNAIKNYSQNIDRFKSSEIPSEELVRLIKDEISQATFWQIINDMVEKDELEVQYAPHQKRKQTMGGIF